MDEKVEFIPVFATFDKGMAALMKSLFDANSISYYVDNEHAASLAFGEISGLMTFMVNKKQADFAQELVKSAED